MYRVRVFAFIAGLLLLAQLASAQEVARLVVMIWDQTNASVPQAKIILTDKQRGVQRTGMTNDTGSLLLEGMPPGEYQLEVEKLGFNKLVLSTVNLHARDLQSLQLTLQVAQAQATVVNVTAVVEGVLTDTSTGTVLSGNYAQNLPMSSRTVQSLLLLTPGVLSVTSGTGDSGIHANGLRSNTNYFMIDGTSANAAPTIVSLNMNMGGPMGGGPGGRGGAGSSSGMNDNGSLFLPMDAVQEVRVQTSTFAPEFGRSPGAQVSILSRSGGNDMHGSAYEYLRNERMNANDWFANSTGFNRQKMRQNNYGGSLGGAIKPSKVFYFGSYEMLDYWQPSTAIDSVPSLTTRASASSKLAPYLNAFPVPNGPDLTYGAAQFFGVYSTPNKSQSGTMRLDRTFRKSFATFLRYSYTSSDAESRGGGGVSTSALLTKSNFKSQSLIAAATWNGHDDAVNDLRLSVTQSKYVSDSTLDNFGGAIVPADSALFPSGVTTATGTATIYVVGMGGFAKGQRSQNTQNQINLVFNQSVSDSVHQAKAGFDYRIQLARHRFKTYSNTVSFNGLTGEVGSLLSGYATNAIVTAGKADRYPMYQNFSFYIQDTFKASKRSTVTYGIRWDVNPAPSTYNSDKPVGLDYSNNIVDEGPLYKTKWFNLAPRIGWTRMISDRANRELVFRTGAGIFYDVGYGSSTATYNGPPFANSTILNNTFDSKIAFPLTATNLTAPSLPATRPYGQVASADSQLKAPLVYQWNATLEHRLGMGHMLSVGYVGNAGRRLLAQETSRSFVETEYNMLMITSNGAGSDYHGLQVQYRRALARRIQAQVSYTWSHALDSASSDTSMGGFALMRGMDRGSSDYDARHVLNVSASMQLPSPKIAPLRWVFGGWATDYMFNARTGLPFDVRSMTLMTISADTDDDGEDDEYRQFYSQVRPNYLGGSVWIADAHAPGGKKLNLAAFAEPDEGYMGNLGRNTIRGFGAAELSASLRRQINIGERFTLQIRAEAFNVLNSPNYANPDPYEGANLVSPNFGVVTRMLNRSYGGATSSYQMGGPRSAQISLRLQF